MNEELIVITTLAEMEVLSNYLENKEYVAYDIETTGVDKDAKIIGFSVCSEVDIAFYVVLHRWDPIEKVLVELETTQGTIKILQQLKTKKLITQNGIFDCRVTYDVYKVQLVESIHTDTMVLGHLLDENRRNGLKELGVSIFGDDAAKEQKEMKASVLTNGGVLTKDKYELYKADWHLLARYGAKDAILTLKLFYHMVPILFEEGLDKFFYDEETMPLFRGPTYDLNSIGLRIDSNKLVALKGTLEAECLEAKSFILKETHEHVKDKYPGTSKVKMFNINSGKQLAWLLYVKLGNDFGTLTKEGKELAKHFTGKIPYSFAAKREFMQQCRENKDRIWKETAWNPKTKKMARPKKVGEVWNYLAADKTTLKLYSKKYKWVEKLLEYSKNQKLLNTYVIGIQSRARYNIIYPSFLQHGTTSGRYSSRNPNFQNLPRKDKRIKDFIISRPGKVFVGADYSQLEPRVFTSVSQEQSLLDCFRHGDDFYSVIGCPTFGIAGVSLKKDEPNSFSVKYPNLRDSAKVVALSIPYGTLAFKLSAELGKSVEEAQEVIDDYFANHPKVHAMMLESHEMAKEHGKVYSLYGRPRRMPQALEINKLYGKTPHAELPANIRNTLNLAMNHRVQSSGASIINRASISFFNKIRENNIQDCHIVMQVHDELIAECNEVDGELVRLLLQEAMETTTELPGVDLVAEPKIGKTVAELK